MIVLQNNIAPGSAKLNICMQYVNNINEY